MYHLHVSYTVLSLGFKFPPVSLHEHDEQVSKLHQYSGKGTEWSKMALGI